MIRIEHRFAEGRRWEVFRSGISPAVWLSATGQVRLVDDDTSPGRGLLIDDLPKLIALAQAWEGERVRLFGARIERPCTWLGSVPARWMTSAAGSSEWTSVAIDDRVEREAAQFRPFDLTGPDPEAADVFGRPGWRIDCPQGIRVGWLVDLGGCPAAAVAAKDELMLVPEMPDSSSIDHLFARLCGFPQRGDASSCVRLDAGDLAFLEEAFEAVETLGRHNPLDARADLS